MMNGLVASYPRRQSGPATYFVSLILHTGLLALCVIGTRTAVKTVQRIVADTTLFYLPRVGPAPVDKPPPVHGGGGGGGGGHGEGLVLTANPPPKGFQTVAAISDIPTEIPAVDRGATFFDARDFSGRGVEGGVGWGVAGGTGPVEQAPVELRDALYTAETGDRRFVPAEIVVRPEFQYPVLLREAGVTGRVVVQFVIDTLGDVEPGSVRVLEKSHEAFADAARTGVLQARFTPAYFGERPVRQLSKWPVKFTLATSKG
jgi:protein TonB